MLLKDDLYMYFTYAGLRNVSSITKCLPPCYYTKYSIGMDPMIEDTKPEDDWVLLNIQTARPTITVRRETLVYPLSSLVAEVGGALGLFVGFSFIMVWDSIELVLSKLKP